MFLILELRSSGFLGPSLGLPHQTSLFFDNKMPNGGVTLDSHQRKYVPGKEISTMKIKTKQGGANGWASNVGQWR